MMKDDEDLRSFLSMFLAVFEQLVRSCVHRLPLWRKKANIRETRPGELFFSGNQKTREFLFRQRIEYVVPGIIAKDGRSDVFCLQWRFHTTEYCD